MFDDLVMNPILGARKRRCGAHGALNFINRTHIRGPFNLEWGGGVSWYNFKFENADNRIDKTNTSTIFFTDQRDISSIKSKLTATYLNVSLVPMLDFGRPTRVYTSWRHGNDFFEFDRKRKRGFRIGAGGYAGYRLASHSKIVYEDTGDKEKEKETSNFFLENFRYGIRGQLGFARVDLFVNYDMNELFSEGRGPELNALSFGFILL